MPTLPPDWLVRLEYAERAVARMLSVVLGIAVALSLFENLSMIRTLATV